MVKVAASPILQMIRRAVEDPRVRKLPDHELLQRFHVQQDEAAFHALLRRHGAMVLDVCRAVLGNEADVEDAFQATFLVLARKAASVRKTASLGSWLHGVAHRTALKAWAQSVTRQKHEARAPIRQASEPDDLSWREVRRVLHEEVNKLSVRYQAPLVLCYLEGKTQGQAADELGLAKSTLRERVERGQNLLRVRLVRRGLGPAALLAATVWPGANASAGVPLSLVTSTLKAASLFAAVPAADAGAISATAATLAEGVLKTMFQTKLKVITVLLAGFGLFGGGVIALSDHGSADQRAALQHEDPTKPDANETAKKPALPPRPYLPTAKDATLVYRYAVNVNVADGPAGAGQGVHVLESEVTEVVTAVKQADAGTVVTLRREETGKGKTGTDTYLVSGHGLFTTGTSVVDPFKGSWTFDRPACLLKLPHENGNKWEYDCPAQPGGLVVVKATRTAHGPEEVVVPAGKFTAIRVEHKGTANGKVNAATFWYAPEVGLVKMVAEDVVQELKSFKWGNQVPEQPRGTAATPNGTNAATRRWPRDGKNERGRKRRDVGNPVETGLQPGPALPITTRFRQSSKIRQKLSFARFLS